MKTVKVVCWEIRIKSPGGENDMLNITYPEGHMGHNLITCTCCGQIYAFAIEDELYLGPPLKDKLKGMNCIKCGNELLSNHAQYPETYRSISGKIYSYSRSLIIPPDETSIVKEFPGIY